MRQVATVGVLVGLLGSGRAEAGPWVRDPGHYYVKGAVQRFFSNQFVNENNEVVELEGSRFEGDLASVYGEVGLARGLQTIVMVPYSASRNRYDDPEIVYAYRWVGDAELALEYGRAMGGMPVSVNVTAKLPAYNNSATSVYGAQSASFPILGDGQVDLTLWLAAGGGFSAAGQSFWAFGEAGYRHRTEWFPFDSDPPAAPFVDGVTYHGQVGWMPEVGGRGLGWAFVDVLGIQNVVNDGRTKQFTQFSAGLAGKVYARAEGASGPGAIHIEAGAAWLPIARSSGTGWSMNVGASVMY